MILSPSEIDFAKLKFGEVKLQKTGAKSVNVTYSGKKLLIETPSIPITYGLSIFDQEGPEKVKYSLDLSMRGAEDNESIAAFQKFFADYDAHMLKVAEQHHADWLNMDEANPVVIKHVYTPCLKFSRDKVTKQIKPYPPTVKATLRKKFAPKGTTPVPLSMEEASDPDIKILDAEFYDGRTAPLQEFPGKSKAKEVLSRQTMATFILEHSGVWLSQKFGTTWRVVQVRIDNQPEQIRGPAFKSEAPDIRAFVSKSLAIGGGSEEDEGGDDDGVLAAVLPPPVVRTKPAEPVKAAAPPTFEDDEAVTEPVKVPAKKVFKKVTKA